MHSSYMGWKKAHPVQPVEQIEPYTNTWSRDKENPLQHGYIIFNMGQKNPSWFLRQLDILCIGNLLSFFFFKC